jgi:hypothetical protein
VKDASSYDKWDALVDEEVTLFINPDSCPLALLVGPSDVWLARHDDIQHLTESFELARALLQKSSVTVVEADERSYRICRISCIKVDITHGKSG